jgi:hypothetical protein
VEGGAPIADEAGEAVSSGRVVGAIGVGEERSGDRWNFFFYFDFLINI